MAELFLRDDLARAWRGLDAFVAAGNQRGETVRVANGRRTVRFETGGAVYFAKVHDGVGWREIGKNLLGGKPPILGARNEYLACRRLAAAGIAAPVVAAYGCRGRSPARRQSFIVCDALTDRVSLEDVAAAWAQRPPTAKLRRRLLLAVAELARDLHAAGVAHRDFYLCHILADAKALARGEVRLAVIDLHRARTARRVTKRWRLRDLAALRHSAAGLALSPREELRFLAHYCGLPPRTALRRHGALWRRVGKRVERLAARAERRGEDPAATLEARALPFNVVVQTANGASAKLRCVSALRRIPGRRLVMYAFVDDRPAAVKCFFGNGARRRCQAERDGLHALAGSGVGTAALLDTGRCAGGYWSAATWLAGSPPEGKDLAALIDMTGKLHRHGVLQRDPHAGNFVMTDGAPLALDGSGVRTGAVARLTLLLNRGANLRNLARLMAAFDVRGPALAAHYRRYCAARGWAPRAAEEVRLGRLTRRAGQRRRRAYVQKTERRGTEFERRGGQWHVAVYRRVAMCPALERLLQAPEAAVATGERLKDGNSATVVRVCDGTVRYVVKRFNAKPERARRAWRNGHRLSFCGVPTAQPLALITSRRRGPAYLVLEDLGDDRLDLHVARHGVDAALADGVERLFDALREEGLTHGDTKATNFIVRPDGVVALVDLDALRRAWLPGDRKRDALRFARNWEGAVAAAFAERLGRPA